MEQIIFIHTPDCRDCVKEIEAASKRKLRRIRADRRHIPKCKGCQRLADKGMRL